MPVSCIKPYERLMDEISENLIGPFQLYSDPALGEGFVLDWLVCGLFAAPMDRDYDAIPPEQMDDLLSVGGEERVAPYEGMVVKWKGTELRWVRKHNVSPTTGFFDDQYVRYATEWFPRWGYVATYLESPDDREALLWVGAKQGFLLWVNHRMLGARRGIPCGDRPDQAVFRARLTKGLNLILAKIWCCLLYTSPSPRD